MGQKQGESVYITAGLFKGQKIVTPGGATHPMGARERIALFNMIGNNLLDFEVLDAYAGSGALGIEALSRRAAEVTFIENNTKAAGVIRANLKALGLVSFVETCSVRDFKSDFDFHLVLADPPYDDFKIDEVMYLTKFVAENGLFVLSHPGEAPEVEGFKLLKTHKYARARISVYQNLS